VILLDAPQGPAEQRGFFHRKLIRAAKTLVTQGPLAAGVSLLAPVGSAAPRRAMTKGEIRRAGLTASPTPRPRTKGEARRALAASDPPCPGVFNVKGPGGICIDLTALPPGGAPAFTPRAGSDVFGEAVMGRYGAALSPGSVTQTRMVCPRGTVLGNDNLCYNKRDLKKSERKWIPERRPLLTGGDLNAITRARKAGRAVAKKTMWLQDMGMLPKPAAKTRRKKHAHALPAPAVSVSS